MDEDKKVNFRIEIVEKSLVFTAIQYALLQFTFPTYFAHAQLKL